MSNIDFFKPIRIFGCSIIFIGVLGLLLHLLLRHDVRYTFEFQIFILLVSFFHILLGMGVTFKKKWSFNIFRYYLYLLYLAIPIGTYVSIKTLEYIKKYDIKNKFE